MLRNMKKIETGRVQEGSNSNQNLVHVSGYKWGYSSYETTFRILPESTRILEKKDLRNHCTQCGKRAGHNHKYCSACGSKL